jgi:hypothetical protein
MKMKTRNIILALMTWLILTTGVVNAAVPTNLALDYNKTNVDRNLRAGDSGILTIVITNTGSLATDVQVLVSDTGDFRVSKKWNVGRIDSLGTKTISGAISVNKDALPGVKNLPIRVLFNGLDSEDQADNNQEITFEFPVRIFGEANFQLAVDSSDDFYKDLAEKLTITGTTKTGATDLSATLSSSCSSIVGSSKAYVGTVEKSKNFKINYMIQPNQVGICSFNMQLDYSDLSGNRLSETLPVGINVQRYDVDFKITDVTYVGATPGSTANITLKIDNVGSASANDVSMSLGVTDPLVAVGSSERYIGNVKSHQEIAVSFGVSIDSSADIKSYDVPVLITYFDLAGNKQFINKSVGIKVDGKPEIKVIIQKIDLLTSGTKSKVTLDIVNKGFAQVKFLNLKVLSTDKYDVTSASEVYIGNLDSDSTDSQDFEVQVKDNVAPGKIPLKIEVSYKEKNNNLDHTEPINLEMTVLSMQDYAAKQPAGSPIMMVVSIVGGLLALVVGLIVLWFVIKIFFAVIGFLDRKLFKRK